ncbi:vacuolar protein sorting/targeting protein PEP1 [Serendipita sp. 396]|nr:vacuolar protein sorting/targeting protein PEP1 [Serendipita sp. 396]
MRGLLGLALVIVGVFTFQIPQRNVGFQNTGWNLSPILGARAASSPEISVTYFPNLPMRLYYFDDTTTVLYFDPREGTVHISEDEGKSWRRVEGVPEHEADQLVEHPFDNRMAFILTKGKTHYRTEDRGKTWRSFEMPLAPAYTPTPLAFHADSQKSGYILYQGTKCERHTIFGPKICHDETFFTKSAFSDEPGLLLRQTSKCIFAHSSKEFLHQEHSDLIFCLAFDASSDDSQSIDSSRLLASQDFFKEDRRVIDFGIGTRLSRGVVAMGVVSKFLVVAMRDLADGSAGEMMLYVTVDAKHWAKAHFPHASNSRLHENSYTIVESTTHSLGIDVQSHQSREIGTLFVSNSNGTYFVESLKDTHRSNMGYVDFEDLVNIEGVGLANYVSNAREVDGGSTSFLKLKSVITYDDGSSWAPIPAPKRDMHDKPYSCDANDVEKCSLHLHSVSNLHNLGRVFSSTAPGFVMGVGSVSDYLFEYEKSDTYLSKDAGRTWKQVRHGAHKYEFGDQGNIIVIMNDEEYQDHLRYSIDLGEHWPKLDLGIRVRAMLLTTIPDSTSQSFILLGALSRKDQTSDKKFAVIHIDFSRMRTRKCTTDDLEKWYARSGSGHDCIMGHKQWFWRRKPDSDCYIGNKFQDPESHSERCLCTAADYECDYNYVRQGDECVPMGLEPIPPGVCVGDTPNQKYEGSSGYRLIPGNTCKKEGGVVKDEPVTKPCDKAQPEEGSVVHQKFKFPAFVGPHAYFRKSKTVLAQLSDSSIWQSSNEGYTWKQLFPDKPLLTFYMHTYADDRAYLFTPTKEYYYTTDGGRSWHTLQGPLPPNRQDASLLAFHPVNSDYLIWSGDAGCESNSDQTNCRVESYYSLDHGRNWHFIEKYVKQCAFLRDTRFKVDDRGILCESYRDKRGNQHDFGFANPLELIYGSDFYKKKEKLFDQIVGFATFSEFLLVAELTPGSNALDLQVSLNGKDFARGLFPPDMRLDNRAYTILESTTDAVFLHVTMSNEPHAEWGNLLKSNSNGTYYGLSLAHVNRNGPGYVDYEKMIGINGVILVNVVSNPDEVRHTKVKKLQTRISHNDGGSWQRLNPPLKDSTGAKYPCQGTKCSLHIHGYTERTDPRTTFSSPSVVGLMLAVGNVGETLAPYRESDTFLTRDAGLTWEEVHKDAHMWEFGDSGSILVIVNDEEPTDHVQYTTDEGLHWKEYNFGTRLRVVSLTTVPEDNSRKFMLVGFEPRERTKSVVIHLDFSALTHTQCKLDIQNSAHDDFELWSPSEVRDEQCLFGTRTFYYRRRREANCFVGQLDKPPADIRETCTCTEADFECEYNHIRNDKGECVLASGALPLRSDDSCQDEDEDYWYERTAYRKIPKSQCSGGLRLDRGQPHVCPGFRAHGAMFWWTLFFVPFGFTALVAFWYYRRGGYQRGTIRLPDTYAFSDSGPLATLASIPWFIVGIAGIAWSYIESLPFFPRTVFRSRRGYRHVAVDEDAQVLRFEDDD